MSRLATKQGCCVPIVEAPMRDADAEVIANAFSAIADPVRLQLLALIAAADGGEACACNLVGPVNKSQPTVSHHLKVLFEAGLITREKRGTWMWYSVVNERLEELRAVLATKGNKR